MDLRCSLWLKYGVLAKENAVILVNTIGTTLFLLYVMIYWVFTLNKKVALRQFVLAVAILLGAVSYTEFYEEDRQEALDVMGTWFQFIYN